MIVAKNDILKAIESIEELTTLFYQQKVDEGYQKLDSTLTYIAEAIDYSYKYNSETMNYINEMQIILNKAVISLEKKDTILLSDILNYELKGVLETVLIILN